MTLIERAIYRVTSLRYFPQNNPEAPMMVGELLAEICGDDAELQRAINLIPRLFSEWIGLAEFSPAAQRRNRGWAIARFAGTVRAMLQR